MELVDLRSDTVTQPTSNMRRAMAQADVGDDVYGEDPNINRLQELSAALFEKEAALFLASGTMGNLAAVLAHCGRGDEVILGSKSHTFLYEAGGISALGGVHSCQLPNQADGTINVEDILSAIRPDDPHQPVSRLICLENTHNRCGGISLSAEYTAEIGQLAQQHNLRLHIDGARIFNAAVDQGVSAAELAAPADSITFCLSKGLSAPVGSVLCGSREFIERAHRIRKQLGGGMRQAGILAAAGIVALETMTQRLEEDHQHAQLLAQGLSNIAGLVLDPNTPQTNMVFLSLAEGVPFSADEVATELAKKMIRVGVTGSRRFRLVTHYWINELGIQRAIEAFKSLLG
ncbi:MAG: low-specificity L-threonine aldolase [Anaerolineales bacterium]|jgi:threonine aldolase